jgi:hypothetical protein
MQNSNTVEKKQKNVKIKVPDQKSAKTLTSLTVWRLTFSGAL